MTLLINIQFHFVCYHKKIQNILVPKIARECTLKFSFGHNMFLNAKNKE